jgi:hypothetical protein
MADQWYYTQQNQRQGPVSEEQLKQLAASGQLKLADKVWKKGMAAWQAASLVEGLIPKSAADTPPPLPSEPPLIPQSAPSVGVPKSIGITILVAATPLALLSAIGLLCFALDQLFASGKEVPAGRLIPEGTFIVIVVVIFLQNAIAVLGGITALRRSSYCLSLLGSIFAVLDGSWFMVVLGHMEDDQWRGLGGLLCILVTAFCLAFGMWAFLALRRPECRRCFAKQFDPLEAVMRGVLSPLGFQPRPQIGIPAVLIIVGGMYAIAYIIGNSLRQY